MSTKPGAVPDGTDAYAKVTISASSRMARLGLASALHSVIEEEVRLLDPVAYYPAGEPAGARFAHDSSGGDAGNLGRWNLGGDADAQFGQGIGPPTDGLSGVRTSFDGNALRATLPAAAESDWSVLWFFTTEETSTAGMLGWGGIYVNHDTWTFGDLSLQLEDDTAEASAGGYSDGLVHMALLTWKDATSTATLTIDGDEVATRTGDPGPFGELTVGANLSENFGTNRPSPVYTIDAFFFHVAVFDELLTSTDVQWIALAGIGFNGAGVGFSGFAPAALFNRYSEYVSVPTAERDFVLGTTPIAAIDTTGQSSVELMQTVARTDGGILFDARDGTLTYQGREVRYQAAAALTLLAGGQEIEGDYSPRLDRTGLVNDLTVTNPGATVVVRAVDAASRGEYGSFAETLELATDDEVYLRDAAWWRVNTYAEPSLRAPSLSVNLLNPEVGRQDALFDLDLSSRITVTGLPAQAAESSADYFVEGYTENIGHASYEFTFNVSDASPWLDPMVLDDPERGVLDAGMKLAY